MADVLSHIADPVGAAHAASPLEGHYHHGEFGALSDDGIGVTLAERFGLSIADIAAWRGSETEARAAINTIRGLNLKAGAGAGSAGKTATGFNIAPGRWLVSSNSASLVTDLAEAAGESATITDLSHGRTVITVDGAKSRWVLAKLFAVDLSDAVLPVGHGLATAHHDIFASIQRTGADAFDVYVFRSFARSFWHPLCRSAEEVGYRVE